MLQRLINFQFQTLSLLLIFMFSQQSILAQTVCPNVAGFENGSFENVSSPNPPEFDAINHAFGNNYVENWFDANGAADIALSAYSFTPTFTPIAGQYMAQLFTSSLGTIPECHNDAIFTVVDLNWYDHYNLSFYHRNATTANSGTANVTMEVWLTAEQTNIGGTSVMPCADLIIPSNSELLWSSTTFNIDNWSQENICFQGSLKLDQLLFVIYTNEIGDDIDAWYLDAVCLEESSNPCNTFCPAPDNLNCAQAEQGGVLLSWNSIPEASAGYEIQIEFSDPDCCSEGTNITLDPIFTNDNSYVHPIFSMNTCFSWKVRSRCSFGESAWSEKICFRPWECFPLLIIDNKNRNYRMGLNSQPQIFPNPSSGDLNFQLNAESALTIGLEIYSSNGQLIKSFPEEYYPDGNYRKNWTSEHPLVDGLYYVLFKTNFGNFQEKLILSNTDLNR